jgi:ABC-type transport system substrate-binding protein
MLGVLLAIGQGVAVACAQAAAPPPTPPSLAPGKLERLRIAVAPVGWDTNFTWLNPRSGNLDKGPALEFLVGIDRHTGAYTPELAETWAMSSDAKTWTITLRKGIKFHEQWGEFTARDVRHSVFLITQPESVQSDSGVWRTLIGVAGTDPLEAVAKKVEEGVQIIDDYQVVFRLKHAAPEFLHTISANTDLVMESKARWDAGGKELYGKKVVGTGPFEFVERTVGVHVLYTRVENHWRKTPEYKDLEWRWVPEGVTRLATLLTEEVHIADVERDPAVLALR